MVTSQSIDAQPWRLFVDTGGTFTDCVAVAPDGVVHRCKVASSAVLPAVVAEHIDGAAGQRSIAVRFGCPGLCPHLPRGGSASPRGRPDAARRVLGYEPLGDIGRLVLHGPLDLRAGDVLEVASHLEPPLLAAHVVTGTPLDEALPPIDLRLATTRGTNALLERRGARVALLVTRGFRDLLTIGDQRRPDLFALDIVRPSPLPVLTVEIEERVDASGSVLVPLAPQEIERVRSLLLESDVEAVAIALLHAWIAPQHERHLAAALRGAEPLRRAGIRHVIASSERAPTMGLLDRAVRASVDAYLGPTLGDYLDRVALALSTGGSSRLRVLTSAGGLVSAEDLAPSSALLSGPAGGVVGAAAAARASGFTQAIGFDMGGTSTDVADLSGADDGLALRFTHRVGDVDVAAPALAIETVAAGGGSIVWLDRGQIEVGPHSAGAVPGPACYGRGGPLTLTDVDLLLGRLAPDRFEIPIAPEAARQAADRFWSDACREGRAAESLAHLLEASCDIADERMAEAIAAVSIRRGIDPRHHALIAFGGAGGLHACTVAQRLGMSTVVVPAGAGLLSALGLAAAREERIATRTLLATLPEAATALAAAAADALAEADAALRAADVVAPSRQASAAMLRRGIALMRRKGQESTLDVAFDPAAPPDAEALRLGFAQRHRMVYGHEPPPGPVEIESIRVVAACGEPVIAALAMGHRPATTAVPPAAPASAPAAASLATEAGSGPSELHARGLRRAFVAGAWLDAAFETLESLGALPPGTLVRGPAMVAAAHASVWIPPGWAGALDATGALVLRHDVAMPAPRAGAAAPELVAGRLQAIATEMGELLRRTAMSVNVKERLDFSCALLDADGRLAANAPHVPVHLGALGPCVRSVLRHMRPSDGTPPCDVLITNHPAHGGSHLPDVTVVTAVRDGAGALLGFAASRAHHAELGGVRPGSMPPFARSLAEEAVVIPPTPLVVDGRVDWGPIERLLRGAPHPSRSVQENLADLAAAVQANAHGADRLRTLASEVGGPAAMAAHFAALRRRAGDLAARALAGLPRGRVSACDGLDDGTPIAVTIDVLAAHAPGTADVAGEARARIDFTGTGPVHPLSFNATEAIVRSAILYVLRLLVREPLPLNEGLLDALSIHVPFGLLRPIFDDDPRRCPAVGAGNTETSQRVVDVLIAALGLGAASQGTMNNVLYGVEPGGAASPFGYYETIAGGSGATAKAPGASGVHVHMTNTRITDAEILERRHPVRLERFALREGSQGGGRHRGGCGVIRETRFLVPMSLSILSQRRLTAPPCAAGGAPGQPGRNALLAVDGAWRDLGPCAAVEVQAGDLLRVETPGGGGWGGG